MKDPLSSKTIAVIPARGGSKGIPRKNVRRLAGKPLVGYAIESALDARSVGRVIVSTDDPEIGAISRGFGAEVIWRPIDISGDRASSELALLHALNHLREEEGFRPEVLVFIQATSPLTTAHDIDGVVQKLLEEHADSALTVAQFHYFLWRISSEGDAQGVNHDKHVRLMRQEREVQYRETGAAYVMRCDGFLAAKHRFFGKIALYETPLDRMLEIDDPVDLHVAEILIRERQRVNHCLLLPLKISGLVVRFEQTMVTDNFGLLGDGSTIAICSASDGRALLGFTQLGIGILILIGEGIPWDRVRALYQGVEIRRTEADVTKTISSWIDNMGLDRQSVICVSGDDRDLQCMDLVGCGVTTEDASPQLKEAARIVLSREAGAGVLGELLTLLRQKS